MTFYTGTTLIFNTWYETLTRMHHGLFLLKDPPRAILHDPQDYPEPDVFDPRRFLNEDGSLNEDDVSIAFGLGRRFVLHNQLPRL